MRSLSRGSAVAADAISGSQSKRANIESDEQFRIQKRWVSSSYLKLHFSLMQPFVAERISACRVGAYGFKTKLDLGVNDRWNRRILCARHLL
jgi:hypothetical protein